MTQPVPIRPDVAGDLATSPEALMISALLASGRFVPAERHLDVEDLSCYQQLWTFCTEYQARAGHAPGLELVRSKFPEFVFIPGIDIEWAADQLSVAAYGREVRRTITSVLLDLSNNDYDAVSDALATVRDPRRRAHAVAGLDIFDPLNVVDDPHKVALPVPWQVLADTTDGGIARRELWNIGGRFESGKSIVAALFAVVAAEAGHHVRILSLEMNAKKYNRRIHAMLARHDRALQLAIKSVDHNIRGEALERLKGHVAGTIEVIDPGHGVAMDTNTVEDAAQGVDLLITDHVGLLKLPSGVRSISDWRPAAQISNELREINLRNDAAMINIVQVNREGETPGLRPPKVSTISQTDALGQDCDIALMIKKPAETFQVHEVGKNRDGSHHLYYVKFDVEHGDYRQIDKQDALNLLNAEVERNATQ